VAKSRIGYAIGIVVAATVAAMAVLGSGSAAASVDHGTPPVGPGTAIRVGDQRCTLGFVFTGSDGVAVGLTAAHCGEVGAAVSTIDHQSLGTVVARDYDGHGRDIDLVRLASPTVPITSDYPHNGRYWPVLGVMGIADAMTSGAEVCTYGAISGESCGEVTGSADAERTVYGRNTITKGDSGGPMVVIGTAGVYALATVSGYLTNDPTLAVGRVIEPYMTTWALTSSGRTSTGSVAGAA